MMDLSLFNRHKDLILPEVEVDCVDGSDSENSMKSSNSSQNAPDKVNLIQVRGYVEPNFESS